MEAVPKRVLLFLMNRLQPVDSIFERLTFPVALVDGAGRIVQTSPAGERAAQYLLFLAESPRQGEPLAPEALLHGCMQLSVSCWMATEGALLRLTPLSVRSSGQVEMQALLEWLPDANLPDAFNSDHLYQRDKLRILQEVSRAVNSSLILEDIFESLGEVLRQYIPYQEAVIVILDDSQNGIKILVRISDEGDLEISREHNAFAGYEPVVDRILRQPESRLYSRGELPGSFLLDAQAAAALAVPLVNKGVVIGLIAMSTRREGGFYRYQEELLTEVSAQLAVAVENAKFYWQTQAQASREFLINQLTMSIRQSLDIDMILGTAVTELGKVTGVSRCFIRYFAPGDMEKAFQYQLPGIRRLAGDELSFERQVFGLRKDQPYNPFILNDTRDCPSMLATAKQLADAAVKSLAIFPILVRDELVGTITLHQCDAVRSWVIEDIELLRALAEHVGVALNQAQLFSELDQRKRALEQTLEELQQMQMQLIQSEKMAVLGQFVAGIAHEVNTPLGTMVSNNATLKTCIDKLKQLPALEESQISEPATGPGAAQLFTSIDNLLSLNKLASTRIQEIVKNLRNFARLDESELKTVDLHEGIESTILLIQSALDPRVTLVRRYGDDVPPVQCYPGLLNQVFMNLLINANHAIQDTKAPPTPGLLGPEPAMPPELATRSESAMGFDPVTIIPEGTYLADSITIHTRFDRATGFVVIAIHDTGKGIPPENLVKVFDPGFTTKGAGVGTGLGLALCYRIVEKHKGRIFVESQPHLGTTFTVEIPARSA